MRTLAVLWFAGVLAMASPAQAQHDAGVPSAPAGDAGTGAATAQDAGPGADAAGIIVNSPLPPGVEAPRAVAVPSSAKVPIGKRFSLFVTITYSKGMEVNLPSSLQLGGAFEEMRRTNTRSTNAAGEPVREFEIELMAWVVGQMQIPPIRVTYAVQGSVHEVRTKPVPIQIITMIGDGEEKLRDIVPPVSVSRKDYTLLYILGGIGFAVACVLFGLQARRILGRRRKRRRHAVEAAIAARPLGPAEEALVALSELESSELLTGDDREPAYVELSTIVRRYLGRRFEFRALDLTTAEVKRRLGCLPEGPRVIELLGDLLDRADLVKYANYGASEEDARVAIVEARTLVEQTRYHMPPPEVVRGGAVAAEQHWGAPPPADAASTLVGMGTMTDTVAAQTAATDTINESLQPQPAPADTIDETTATVPTETIPDGVRVSMDTINESARVPLVDPPAQDGGTDVS